VERAQRYERPLSAIMAELDRFKTINDERGHATGDAVLIRFAELAKRTVRQSDWIARFVGGEFLVVLPETSLDGAMATAEKIRAAFADAPVSTSTGEISVTASFGVAELAPSTLSPEVAAAALLREADEALYASKRAGRNCVTAAGSGSSPGQSAD